MASSVHTDGVLSCSADTILAGQPWSWGNWGRPTHKGRGGEIGNKEERFEPEQQERACIRVWGRAMEGKAWRKARDVWDRG